jgi:murein DD-endopeptidase MepM/ murein hydrolase activator NlpD
MKSPIQKDTTKHGQPSRKGSSKTSKRGVVVVSSVIFIFIAVLTFSKTAHAGLVSFVSSLLGSNQASANMRNPQPPKNSQTLAILAAHANIDPTADTPADAVPVDDGEALIADIAATNATSTETGSGQISTYAVRQGDTISSVAKMFDVSVNTILWANNLTGKSVLQPGQTLVILPISGITYTVKKGDTIKGIAQKFKADEEDILTYNDLTAASLQIGDIVIVPNVEAPIPSGSQTPKRKITKVPNEPLLDNIASWPSYPGYYIRPLVIGTLTQKLHGHNAIDIGAPSGTPIMAAAQGTIIISKNNGGWNGGYGNYVVISHPNGTQTLYSHMSRVAVKIGQNVTQSQTIGYVGNTGLSTGNHLHYEVRGAKNPEAY